MLGPIDYIVIGFEGNDFDGSILSELAKAVDDGIIRVIDLVFIIKDEDGTILEGEYEDQSADIRGMLDGVKYNEQQGMPLLTDGDIAKIGEQMHSNTAAGVLVLEHTWARGLKQALKDAGGFLIADGRIHPEAVEAAMTELETSNK
jgi:hypothetical protein